MKEYKTLENEFIWLPLEKRKSRFGGMMSPRSSEKRIPLLWLARKGRELYLVNDSGGEIDVFSIGSGGVCTGDDTVITVSNEQSYEYTNIKPNIAVKVDEYDENHDLDFLLQVSFSIRSKYIGCMDIRTPIEKGGIKETVLLWDTGEPGKHVFIKNSY